MKTIDIMSDKLKRNYENENKVFDTVYDPSESEINTQAARSVGDRSDFMIPANTIVIFSIQVENPEIMSDNKCDQFDASINFYSFQTPKFEIPVSYQVVEGKITLLPSDMVRFTPAILGTTETKKLLAKSTLKKPVHIMSVTSSNPNTVEAKIIKNKLYFKKKEEIIEISTVPHDQINSFLSLRNNAIFRYFMYTRNKKRTAALNPLGFPRLTYFDVLAWQVEQKEWDYRLSSRSTETTSIITIETNMIHNISIPVKTVITKPSLLNVASYDFGKVEVGTVKRGSITIHNPSEHPLEVSFYVGPINFLEEIMKDLLSDEKLIKWKQLCDKATFFDPYGRKMCEGLIELNSLSETRRKNVVDYFIRNYFNFVMNPEVDDSILTSFMSDQQLYLQRFVQNVSDITDSLKYDKKEEVTKNESIFDYLSFWKHFNFPSFYQSSRKIKLSESKESLKNEPYEEIVESLKARLSQMIDDAPPIVKMEINNMFAFKDQSFFIRNNTH